MFVYLSVHEAEHVTKLMLVVEVVGAGSHNPAGCCPLRRFLYRVALLVRAIPVALGTPIPMRTSSGLPPLCFSHGCTLTFLDWGVKHEIYRGVVVLPP